MRDVVCVRVMPRLCVPLQDIINSVVSENSYTPLTDVFCGLNTSLPILKIPVYVIRSFQLWL